MSESGISPLAKRLAEENNVNWRGLQGSGDGGKVVERDVLEYLARVMSGEEATNPTAEPVPEGMEAWPEEDIAAFSTEQVTADSSDSEILDEGFTFEEDLSTSQEVVQAQEGGPSASESIDEDIFLFDDEFDDEGDLLADTDVSTAATITESPDDLFKTLDDEEGLVDIGIGDEATNITEDVESDLLIEAQQATSEDIASDFEDVLEATEEVSTAVSVTPSPIGDLPVLLQGKVLRRHLPIKTSLEARESIAKELNLSGLNLTPFLIKAVFKALQNHSLGTDGNIVLINVTDKISLHSIPDSPSKDLKALMNTINQAKQSEVDAPNASLLVADLSDHQLDEIMLSKDVPVLSLGSASSEGNSTLSLSGNIPPDQGTAFLTRVAELLSEPVRLII